MRIVLFDLGDTLEKEGRLLPGAAKTLQAIQGMRDASGQAPALALISDFLMPDSSSQIPALQQQYYKILDQLGISRFFRPLSRRVTLSSEVGVRKPDQKIFNTAIKKIDKRLGFQDAIFITENLPHIVAARHLGMTAIHFKGPTQATGEVDQLLELIPLIKQCVEKPM